MRDEALIHFFRGDDISAGIHLAEHGGRVPDLLASASPRLDPQKPGKSVAGFCASFFDLVYDIRSAPSAGWQEWGFAEWDNWFGRINGTFLVDLEQLQVVQYPMYQARGRIVQCDLIGIPGRISLVHSRVA